MMKIRQCKLYGAEVIIRGENFADAKAHGMSLETARGLTYINGYDDPYIIAGQGTIGLEIIEQMDSFDAVIVPIGGGGLIAGIAVAIKTLRPDVTIIGVEPERCQSFTEAMKVGKPVYTETTSTLADGLAVPVVGYNALETVRPLIDKIVTVNEEMIAIAILRLVELEKAVVEGAGAAGLAAVLAGLLPELKGKKVVIPLCGGNIDTTVLGRCLERGLAVDGRLVKFKVTVTDRPGGIAELTRCISNLGVSIKDMMHERAWLKSDVFSVQVKVVAETRDKDHAIQLEKTLRQRYKEVEFFCAIKGTYLNSSTTELG
jgi:threonine dehydratase